MTEEQLSDIVTVDTDVPKVDPAEEDNTFTDAREDIYAAYEARQKELAGKNDDAASDDAASDDPVTDDDIAEDAQTDEEGDTDDDTETDDSGTADEMVTVKVYGESIEVPKVDVDKAGGVNAYQIIAANRKRLDETNALREEVLAEKERLATERKEWEDAHTAAQKQEDDAAEQESENRLNDLYERREAARADDDIEEAARLSRQIDDERATAHQQPNLDQIVEQRLASHDREADRQAGVRWFNENHQELASQPQLFELVNQRVIATLQQYPNESPSAVIRFHADDVAKWWEENTAPSQKTTERVEKKRRLRQPRAASARQQSKAEPKPETRSEYIARLRGSRGLDID